MKFLLLSFLFLSMSLPTYAQQENPMINAHDFSFDSIIDGAQINLADFKGQTVMIVNTASLCGFTKQYDDLQKLYETYKDQNFTVIGVPSNDFGGQEPGSEEDIKEFCETNFNITFPMTAKQIVSGDNAHPFYKWAANQKQGGFLSSKPRWNFHKYLIGPDGNLIGSFGSMTNPMSDKITSLISGE